VAAEGIPSYDELKLRIGPGEGGAYQVVAFGPDGSTASGTFALPFDETQLDNFVLRIGRPRRGVRAYRSSQMEDAKHFGSQLFDALISGAVHDVYLGARRVAEQNDKGLRVTLYLTDVPALMEVPWEFLYDRPAFLAQSIYTPVVRSLDLKTVRPPRKLTLPLRILGMVSCPQGFDTLDVEREQRNLEEALGPLEREGMVELRWLERATLSALDDVVSSPEEVHVLHYIGHGAYDARTESGILVLENSEGQPHEVTGEELGSLLQDERSLRLVVLNSCEGARASHVDPFSGAASSLVECGIPAVVGMQFEITDEAAITFAGRLYNALVQGFPIDAALAQSRKAIFAAGNDTEFGTPVLFLRTGDARLFDPEQSPARRRPVLDLEPDREEAETERTEQETAGPPGTHKRRPRPWILLLAAGVAAVALAAVLISRGTGGSSDTAPAGWQSLPGLPNKVLGAGVAAYKGMIWVVGGTRDRNHDPVTDVYAYDPQHNHWLTASDGIPQLPDARGHASLVATKNPDRLYLIGGNGLDGTEHPVEATVFRLDKDATSWTEDDHPLPEPRESGAAAFDGTRIVFAGGNDNPNGPKKDDIWARAPDGEWQSIGGSLHEPRDHLAAATNGAGTVWFVGGTPDRTAVDLVRGDAVSQGPSVEIAYSAAVGIGRGFCTIGGSTESGRTADSQCRLSSYSIPQLETPTSEPGAARLGDTVYAVGGHTADTDGVFGVRTAEALRIPRGL
jgi:CHAT domain-containing protein/Kelch motif protein